MNSERGRNEASFMDVALDLAKKSHPSPNPRVGAIVVRDGEIVGEGFHERPGMPHAEVIALAKAGRDAEGADLYVTLEPCCHQGKTGPCAPAIAEAKIARAFVGMEDPDPRVSGQGLALLKENGVEVHLGVRGDACEELLAGYTLHRKLGRPLFHLKAATTLDGRIATTTGDSRWISSEPSRRHAHQMRSESDAVLVGIGTVIKDDPMLTTRHVDGPSPLRVVVDSNLKTPLHAALIRSAQQTPTLLVHAAPVEAETPYSAIEGVRTIRCDRNPSGEVNLQDLAKKLGEMGILEVLVEGGGKIHGSFVKEGLADQLSLFVAPKIIGSGIQWSSFEGTLNISDGALLRCLRSTPIGDDLLIQAKFER